MCAASAHPGRDRIEVAKGITVEDLDHPGPNTLHNFIVAWHGRRWPGYGIAPEQMGHGPLPRLLRSFYEFAGRWPGLISQNHLLGPTEIEELDGRLLLYVENQGVWLWATAEEGDDPAVWSRENVSGAEWEIEGEHQPLLCRGRSYRLRGSEPVPRWSGAIRPLQSFRGRAAAGVSRLSCSAHR